MEMEQDLSIDAAPVTDQGNKVASPEEDTGNQQTNVDAYSFMSQLFSPDEEKCFKKKIDTVFEHRDKMRSLEEYGDVLLIHEDEHKSDADTYCGYLNTLKMRLGTRQSGVTVKASPKYKEVESGASKGSGLDEAKARFTFVFLYVKPGFNIDKMDEDIEEREEDCLVIVYDGVDRDADNIPGRYKVLSSVCASDRSKDTENALIKKLERKLYMREAKEKKCIEKCYKTAEIFI
ncbi:uncharacterized protein LOC132549201 [Ylistrum balloti]|uniref:uncharacterized protein LOC132549201 n=1 Tax=Ylistrum balloti TaxID=509963 RepID=UPI002905E650|nr:uncharacterized protein LOC132549201 [Ylistrum balloti]